ncbi:hypothetical protein D9M71_475860 [compost metagenome]
MHLALHRTVHPAGFAAAGEDDADAEQHAADHRVRPHPEDLRRQALVDRGEGADAGRRHAEQDAEGRLGPAGGPEVAGGAGEADLRALDQAAEQQAEQAGHAQHQGNLEAPGGEQQSRGQHRHTQAPLQAGAPGQTVGIRQGGCPGADLQRRAQHRQQAELHAEPGAGHRRQHEGPGMHGEHRDAGEEGCEVAAHGQARTEAGDDPADQSLQQTAPVGRPAQADIAGPQRTAQRAEEHTDDHHAVDPVQRRTLQADQLEVAPLLWLQAEPG